MVSDRSEPSSTLPLPCIRTLVLVSGIKLVNSSYGDIIMNKVHGLHSKQCEHSSVSTAARARQCEHSSARAAAVLVLYPWCLGLLIFSDQFRFGSTRTPTRVSRYPFVHIFQIRQAARLTFVHILQIRQAVRLTSYVGVLFF